MKNTRHHMRRFAFISALFAMSLGCGNSGHLERGQVIGTVTLDGKPVEAARLLFRPATGRAGRGEIRNGEIIRCGTYEEDDGLVLGTHLIAIQPNYSYAPATTDSQDEEQNQSSARAQTQDLYSGGASVDIPSKYQNMEESGLTTEITGGENELNLKLTSE